ncbi:N-acetylmuramoyl-L-alanine amidase [Palleronia sp. THAF1]|uniref:N-acetylmuramoyl-L-alanine amidase n=1 Tax=Palleronia sp. THAF1 TaxID=2587842 RepID=UPI0012A8764B|nr:1,6-anhydro-N-acetylmuramyl-L-alanine amidase AmpD [Palleronia sp. THAF1]
MEPGPVPGRSGLTAIWRPSPNCGPRRDGGTPRLIVLHYTAMTSAERAAAWLCNPESQVSAHYVIDRMGSVQQLVDEADRAWHAGAGAWGDCRDVNSNSIGLEIDNTGTMPFAAAQMNAVEALVAGIMERWSIPARGVIGHSDCAPGRKVDPGARFDWARLARQGLAAATPDGEGAGDFLQAIRAAGYTADAPQDALLASLRMRHRPWAKGPCDVRDVGIAQGLAGQAAIDRAAANA